MKKNKAMGIITILSLVAILLISGVLAYLTSTDTATNEFTIGNVEIKLLEPEWKGEGVNDSDGDGIPDFAENIAPNTTIPKDPQIKNTGTNNAYVYLKVTVPVRKVIIANDDGTLVSETPSETPLFTYNINSDDWTEITSAGKEITNDSNEVIGKEHVYYYKTVLEKDAITSALFNSVTFANVIEGQAEQLSNCSVKVDAYAIQSDGLNGATIEGAYAIYINQNGNV